MQLFGVRFIRASGQVSAGFFRRRIQHGLVEELLDQNLHGAFDVRRCRRARERDHGHAASGTERRGKPGHRSRTRRRLRRANGRRARRRRGGDERIEPRPRRKQRRHEASAVAHGADVDGFDRGAEPLHVRLRLEREFVRDKRILRAVVQADGGLRGPVVNVIAREKAADRVRTAIHRVQEFGAEDGRLLRREALENARRAGCASVEQLVGLALPPRKKGVVHRDAVRVRNRKNGFRHHDGRGRVAPVQPQPPARKQPVRPGNRRGRRDGNAAPGFEQSVHRHRRVTALRQPGQEELPGKLHAEIAAQPPRGFQQMHARGGLRRRVQEGVPGARSSLADVVGHRHDVPVRREDMQHGRRLAASEHRRRIERVENHPLLVRYPRPRSFDLRDHHEPGRDDRRAVDAPRGVLHRIEFDAVFRGPERAHAFRDRRRQGAPELRPRRKGVRVDPLARILPEQLRADDAPVGNRGRNRNDRRQHPHNNRQKERPYRLHRPHPPPRHASSHRTASLN